MECDRNRYFYNSKENPFKIMGNGAKGVYGFKTWKQLLAKNRNPELRESNSIWDNNPLVKKDVSLFNKNSKVYFKAVKLGVPLPVDDMKLALKRFTSMTGKDSSCADL